MIHKHFKTKAKFSEELAKSPSGISDSDICFIKDTGEIWTHGKFYAGSDALEESKANKSETVSNVAYDTTNKKITKTINGTTTDVVTTEKLKTDMSLTKSDVGLGNVGNFKAVSTAASQGLSSTEKSNARANIGAGTSSLVIGTTTGTAADGKIVNDHIANTNNPHSVTKTQVGLSNVTNDSQVKRSEMGVANGVATLGVDGKVPASQLPSFVDDVIEGYYYDGKFYEEATHTTEITPEGGKIYIDLSTEKTYRWGGSTYAEISAGLALGETQGTAYEGSKGAADAAAIATLQTDKANKSEMAIEAVTGDATKKEITLKTGLSQEVVVAHQDITGKADKVASATANNFAGLDASGNLKDSGSKASDFATAAQGDKADSAIQSVKVNGTALTPDANKAVNVEFEIPERVTSEELATFVV